MDKMNSLLDICLIISCLFQSGLSANSMISCPSTFLEKKPSNLQLTIVNSTFSVCSIQPTTVTCRWSPVNATASVICSGSVTSCEKDATSGSCPCVEESGQGFKYSFNFSMLPNQEQGSISCDLDCFVTGNVAKATVESGPNCQNIKFVSECEVSNPCSRGTCRMNTNGAVCDCTGTGFRRPACEFWDRFVISLTCMSTGDGVCVVFFIAGFLCGVLVALTWKVCLLARTDDIRQTLTSEQTKRRIRDFIKQNFVCCCHGIHVEVGANCTEDGLVTITLKHRLIWVYCLRDMASKVEEFIKTEILLEVKPNEPDADYPPGPPMAQPKYTGKGNGQPKKSKSDKEIPLSTVGRSSPPSETSGDEKTRMIPTTKARALPVPANQHEPTSIGIGKSASPRLDPLKQDHSKMTSVERNSGAFSRELPSPVRSPLGPIPSGKQS